MLTESISVVNTVEKCISKRTRDTSDSTCSVNTKIVVKSLQISLLAVDLHGSKEKKPSSKKFVPNKKSMNEVSSVPHPLNAIR